MFIYFLAFLILGFIFAFGAFYFAVRVFSNPKNDSDGFVKTKSGLYVPYDYKEEK